ncbi:hypothetical protein [uncultured Winogradskyella sp.]|uniref:hypothetical protein n=1 Tax=uncultured Winogradskyella sp. TaxID=395353 RepID=UPI0030ECFDFC|tara:strand:- start:132 stop:599 length:468 start_codon:yes stop_codon:yes gene_type:complete
MKKAKVNSIKFIQAKDLQYGKFYEFEIEFDNGDKGFYLSKNENQDKFVIGQDRDYEFTPHDKWPKVKPANPEFNSTSNNSSPTKKHDYGNNTSFTQGELIVAQSCLKAAVDSMPNGDIHTDEILKRAQQFKDWVMTGSVKKNVQQVNKMPDDMPF